MALPGMHRHLPPRRTWLKQGRFPPARFCCPRHRRYDFPLRLLTRCPPGLRIHVLIPGVSKDVGFRPREISLVALPAFPTFRSPYAGEFFEPASPESSPLPWPSLLLRSSALPCPFRVNMTTLQDSRNGTDCRFAPPPRKGIHRFATPGHPGAAGACYVALWRLPRPDFHR